jgi:hypothetical protein
VVRIVVNISINIINTIITPELVARRLLGLPLIQV